MKLSQFVASAVILGKERDVVFEAGTLKIGVDSLSEVETIVSVLEGADRASANVAVATAAVPKLATRPLATAAKTGRVKSTEPNAAVEPKAELEPKAAAKQEPVDEEREAIQGEPPTPKGGNGSAKAEEASSVLGEVADQVAAIKDAKRLADVIIFLQDRGVVSADAIVSECEAMRDGVPVLSRIENMRERVERTLATLGR